MTYIKYSVSHKHIISNLGKLFQLFLGVPTWFLTCHPNKSCCYQLSLAISFPCMHWPFSEVSCLRCWKSHVRILVTLPLKDACSTWVHRYPCQWGWPPTRKQPFGISRTCSENMPTAVWISVKDLIQAHAGTSGICGHPDSFSLLEPYLGMPVCTVCVLLL